MDFILIIFIIVAIIIGGYIYFYNKFRILGVKIDEADTGIEIALNKRNNVLTKLIDVVRSYTKNETIKKRKWCVGSGWNNSNWYGDIIFKCSGSNVSERGVLCIVQIVVIE